MSIRYIPARRFLDPQERLSYAALQLLAGGGRAVIEAQSIGLKELNQDDAIAAVAAIPIAPLSDTLTFTALTSIAAGGSAILSDTVTVTPPASVDTVVTCDQRDDNVYFTAYVEEVPDGLGGTLLRIRFVAHNHGTGSHDVIIGQIVRWSAFSWIPVDPPRFPNAELIVRNQSAWTSTTGVPLYGPIDVPSLNLSTPTFELRDESISDIELRDHDVAVLGSLYTGRRAVLTVVGDKTVAVGAAVLLGTVSFTGATGVHIITGQNAPTPLYTGYVSASNGATTVSIYARNNSFATITVPSGTKLKVFSY